MLRAVLVDVGGTLWPDRLAARQVDEPCLAELARLVPNLDPAQTLAVLRAALRANDGALVQATHSVIGQALRSLGVNATRTDPITVRRALCVPAWPGVSLFAGARRFLEALRDRELRCVVLSNVQVRGAQEYWRDFADLGIAHLVDAVVTSLEVGYRKPHRAMFEAGLRDAGCGAQECVMIGDSEVKDVRPAVALGMRVIRVAIEEAAPASSSAHAIVTSLADARTVILDWTAAAARA